MRILDPIRQILDWLQVGAVLYLDDPELLEKLLGFRVYGAAIIAHWRENGDGSSMWSKYLIRLNNLPEEVVEGFSSRGWAVRYLAEPGDVPSQAISLVARDEKRNGQPMTIWVGESYPDELESLASRAGMTVAKRGSEIESIFAKLVIHQ